MSFYDETLKARHEDDMDDEYGEAGGYGSGSTEEDYEEEEENPLALKLAAVALKSHAAQRPRLQ